MNTTNQTNNKPGNALDRYQAAAGRTSNRDYAHVLERLSNKPELIGLLNAVLGMAGEAGEAADHIKKVVFHGHDLDIEYMLKECGDELWYIADAVSLLNQKLSNVAGINLKKLEGRYEKGFSEAESINRKEADK